MFYNAKNGNIRIDNTDMDYISFGNGQKNLIMVPGLGDGLKTVKGTAIAFAMMYKEFAKDYKVYVFSRKNQLEEGYSTKDMANDQAEAMKKLGISKASIMGVSQGGMIAQYMAIDYPELIDKLILAVTVSRQNGTIQSVVNNWIAMAEDNDYKGIFIDTSEKSYSEKNLKKYRLFYPILSRVGKPKDFSRFIIQADACIHHNTYDELERIKCETLVIGGDSDRVVGEKSSEEIAEKISDSKLILYKGLGHMTYEEAKDFNLQVLNFLKA
ncbi:alpha/beta fold hydrolase [Acetobacterium tundrae]|uniref:Alpha/beta fold hydrolase n=1 Tax=Acetobacterium tundrae TaxID=132932 RepID=A0ABR6WKS5_9FIRM|nr:alpha/beta hydrolase [Acetobacterium tundrae]MBC3796873.1 alpha/beta fold hydrolase [Acetobacterium tundrae]